MNEVLKTIKGEIYKKDVLFTKKRGRTSFYF